MGKDLPQTYDLALYFFFVRLDPFINIKNNQNQKSWKNQDDGSMEKRFRSEMRQIGGGTVAIKFRKAGERKGFFFSQPPLKTGQKKKKKILSN